MKHHHPTRLSPTLAINESVQARRAAGERVLHLGFGEAGLPIPDSVAAVLADAARRNGYGPVAGSPEAREAAAGWFTRRGLPTRPEQVIFAPGSKPLLYALLAVLPGDVVLPRPAWVSYAAQSALAGKRALPVPVPAEAGGVPDPDRLPQELAAARAAGAEPGVLILTVPDNPTGTVARPEHVRAVCAVAERHGLTVIADEIYAELVHDRDADADTAPDGAQDGGGPDGGGPGGGPDDAAGPARARATVVTPPHAATHLPERTVTTTGLSKSLAMGGWRVGFARVPEGPWGERLMTSLTGVASEIWSSVAAPMQAVAAHVLADPPEVLAHIAASRALHARVARAVHREFVAAGARCRPPEAAFYLYPELPAPPGRDGATVAAELLDRHGVGVLPGEAFGDDPAVPRARVATSLLYGDTDEQRWQALRAPDPLALPWIAEALGHLRTALAALAESAAAADTPSTAGVAS